MSLQLDLCQSIQLGSDPVERPGVVQAWKHRVFNEVVENNEARRDNLLCNLGNKTPRS